MEVRHIISLFSLEKSTSNLHTVIELTRCCCQFVNGRRLREAVRNPVNDIPDDISSGSDLSDHSSDEEPPPIRARRMAYDAYGRADDLHRGVSMDLDGGDFAPVENEEEVEEDVNLQKLLQECAEPVYDGSRESRMQSDIVLMTLSTVYGISDAFLSALLTYLVGTILPANNSLPRTLYELKTMIKRLGLEHERIDSCPNGHVLYEGEVNGELRECPRCQHPRYIPDSSSVSYAVTRYFPNIPKLKRVYRCRKVAGQLNVVEPLPEGARFMKSVVDSFQWQEVSRMYRKFRDLVSNLRLGLVADGVCLHGNQSSKHSTWIILIVIYNFPGWLSTKNFFLKLSLLIPGPKAPTSDTIDVYLKPLVRDLLQL